MQILYDKHDINSSDSTSSVAIWGVMFPASQSASLFPWGFCPGWVFSLTGT